MAKELCAPCRNQGYRTCPLADTWADLENKRDAVLRALTDHPPRTDSPEAKETYEAVASFINTRPVAWAVIRSEGNKRGCTKLPEHRLPLVW